MRPTVLARRLGILLTAGGLLGATAFQLSRAAERWAVRGGEPKGEAEALFDPGPSATRHPLVGAPAKVLLLRPSLGVETYRDPVLGEVVVVPNAAFTIGSGVVQDKSLALFAGCSLGASAAGLLLWALLRRAA